MADRQILQILLSRSDDNSTPYIRDPFSRSTPFLRPPHHLTQEVFAIANFRTSTFGNSVFLAAIYFRHSLPDSIRSSPTIDILKGRLFRYLFDLENDRTSRYYITKFQCSFRIVPSLYLYVLRCPAHVRIHIAFFFVYTYRLFDTSFFITSYHCYYTALFFHRFYCLIVS